MVQHMGSHTCTHFRLAQAKSGRRAAYVGAEWTQQALALIEAFCGDDCAALRAMLAAKAAAAFSAVLAADLDAAHGVLAVEPWRTAPHSDAGAQVVHQKRSMP